MNTYLSLKWVHILSSVLLVGTGFGSAFYLFFANRSGNVAAQAVVSRLVVRADTWFTTPAGIVQPITGVAMAMMAGWPLSTPWLAASIGLYGLAGLCWLPVLWLQWRMAAIARDAAEQGTPMPALYNRYARWWEALGYPAFVAMLAIYYLMVHKPALWG
ncbi:DUF2269 family protein [Paracidovorax valerianellae]|uniref:Uncharacterized membrane protein n=1 Tax=Paracidovorax valerianellae TaxID=187868 RepID=A0A1G6MD45_9BURK|nr:DUF2269 domain-containing protein [Paracidovorax valerianellae]MDA8444048.1 DUF2269 domain-containing protein [Paracidovorax valerianellae]SDC53413.1 Uncharacterized membrane protein [Paracidovorax valerianellae]